MDYEYGDYESGHRRHNKHSPAVGLGERAEKGEMHPVDGQAEADDGEAGKNPDEDTEDQEKNFLVENIIKSAKQTAGGPGSFRRSRRNHRWAGNGGDIAH